MILFSVFWSDVGFAQGRVDLGKVRLYGQPDEYFEKGQVYLKIKEDADVKISLQNDGSKNVNPLDIEDVFRWGKVSLIERPFSKKSKSIFDNVYMIQFDQNISNVDFMNKFIRYDFVEYIERVPLIIYSTTTPNDPMLNGQTYFNVSNTLEAYNIFCELPTGQDPSIIAIIDVGFDTDHVDLSANLDLPGINLNGGTNVNGNTHGTNTAGVAGAVTNNSIGVASIGRNTNKILPIKIGNTSGYPGIQEAIDNDAHIISMSWGHLGMCTTYFQIIHNAYNNNSDLIMVASAGNYNTSLPVFPAAYGEKMCPSELEFEKKMVIGVASVDTDGSNREPYISTGAHGMSRWTSNPGANGSGTTFGSWVDIAGYGTNVKTTDPNNGYGTHNGTSFSAPEVASLIGLMKSFKPNASRDEILECLLSSANQDIYNIDGNFKHTLGSGRFDVKAALQCLATSCSDNPIATIYSESTSLCAGDQILLKANNGTAYNWSTGASGQSITVDQAGVYSVTVTFGSGCTSSQSIEIEDAITVPEIVVFGSGTNYGNITANGNVCSSGKINIAALWGKSYSWSGASNPLLENSQILFDEEATVPSSKTYVVTVSDVGGCEGVDAVVSKVVHWYDDNVTINGGASIVGLCTGASETLTASSGGEYLWSTGETSQSITVTVFGQYSVTVSNGDCSGYASIYVYNNDPIPNIQTQENSGTANDGIVCPGTSVTLTASGGTNFSWSTGETTLSITVMPNTSTLYNYSVTVTNDQGCEGVEQVTINANSTDCGSSFACMCTGSNRINVDAGSGTNITDTKLLNLASPYYSGLKRLYNKCLGIKGKLILNNTKLLLDYGEIRMQPGAEIVVESGSELRLGVENIHGCNNWEGITFKSGSEMRIYRSTISDAWTALNFSDNSGSVHAHIYKNTFSNNRVAVKVKGNTGQMSVIPFWSTSFTQNVFSHSNPSWGHGIGIQLDRGSITIGKIGSDSNRNEFKSLYRGIELKNNSSITDYSSLYHNYLKGSYWVYMDNNSTGHFRNLDMATTVLYKTGIYYKNSKLDLNYSTINMFTGVRGRQLGTHLQTIRYSNFDCDYSCVYLTETDHNVSYIELNNFTLGLSGNRRLVRLYGVGSNSNIPKKYLRFNVFNIDEDNNTGLYLYGSNKWQIENQNRFNFGGISNYRTGFDMKNSDYCFVKNNEFTSTSNNTNSAGTVGMKISYSNYHNSLCCNSTDNIQNGVGFYGTALDTRLRHHDFGNHNIGLRYWGSARTSAQIDAGNHWTGTCNIDAQHLGNDFYINQSIFRETSSNWPNSISTPNAVSAQWWKPGSTTYCGISNGGCDATMFQSQSFSNNDLAIAEGEYRNDELGAEVSWELEKELYSKISDNLFLKDGNKTMNDFYGLHQDDEIGQLVDIAMAVSNLFEIDDDVQKELGANLSQIEQLNEEIEKENTQFDILKSSADSLRLSNRIEQLFLKRFDLEQIVGGINMQLTQERHGNAQSVRLLNSMVETKSDFGENEKMMNDIYLQIVGMQDSKAINKSNYAKVRAIAEQCLYDAGPAVFKARTLILNWEETDFDDENLCNQSSKRFAAKETLEKEDILLFPNPSSDIVQIYLPTEGDWSMNISNVSGLSITNTNMLNGKNTIDISKFENGVFLCTFFKDGKQVESKKLIVIH